jgi:hypothetical protein
MRFYKFDSQGPMFLNRGTGTPGAVAANEGRIFYEDGSEEIFYADAAAWIRMYSENNLATLITDIDATGAWIRKDQDDVTSFKVQIDGGMRGDVRSDDNGVCLDIGANPGVSTFAGTAANASQAANAALLNSQNGAFYQNSNNQNAGTLPSGRLTGSYNISITGTARYG